MDAQQENDVFQVLLGAVNSGRELVRVTTRPRKFSREQVKEIVELVLGQPG
jgi:hypothetical protein